MLYLSQQIHVSSLHLLLRVCDTTPPLPIKSYSLKSAINIIVGINSTMSETPTSLRHYGGVRKIGRWNILCSGLLALYILIFRYMVYGPLFVVLLGLRNVGDRFSTAGRFASTDPRIKAACLLPQFDVPCLLPISLATVFSQSEECIASWWLVFI